MRYRTFPGTDVTVSEVGFGNWTTSTGWWGEMTDDEAVTMLREAHDLGVTLYDAADTYGNGRSEEQLAKAFADRRDKVIYATKFGYDFYTHSAERRGQMELPQDVSPAFIRKACDESLKRLKTDYIDLYHLHGFDAQTPIEETVKTLDTLVQSGKVRYIACSNFSGWHLMKSLAVSEEYGWARYVAHQAYYSLVGRDFEWELMPLGLDQKVATIVWSPLGWGRLTGKIRRGKPLPEVSRLHSTAEQGPPVPNEYLFKVVDALDEISRETGKTITQIALNWLLQRPTVANVIVGARNEEQLRQKLAAVGWNLTPEQVARLDAASELTPPYPYWHQRQFARNPKLV